MPTFAIVLLVIASTFAIGIAIAQEIKKQRKRWHRQEIERVRRDVIETQRQLQALAIAHQNWLDDQANEVRKALIMESFRFSHGAAQQAGESEYPYSGS